MCACKEVDDLIGYLYILELPSLRVHVKRRSYKASHVAYIPGKYKGHIPGLTHV